MSRKGLSNISNEEIQYLASFGQGLKSLRVNVAKKSLRIFAYETDVPCATLSRIENGQRIPNLIILKRIAAGFEISISELIDRIEREIPDEIKNFED